MVDGLPEHDSPGDSEEAGRVAFELAKSRLDRQVARLVEVRTNSSVLLAATALIASFLGKTSIDRAGLTTGNWFGLVFLVVGVLAGIRPLWPVRDHSSRGRLERLLQTIPFVGDRLLAALGVRLVFRLHLSPADVLELERPDPSNVRLHTAERLYKFSEENSELVYRRAQWISATAVLLFAQVVAWTTSLALNG